MNFKSILFGGDGTGTILGDAALAVMRLLTRPAAAVLAFNMAVAAFITLLHAPFVSSQGPSKEAALLYLLPALLLLAIGAGRYSFDFLWRRSFERPTG